MAHSSSEHCYEILDPLVFEFSGLIYSQPVSVNLTYEDVTTLQGYCPKIRDFEYENVFSKPMVWVGMYIALASLFCTLAMGADLLHGFRNRKFWFPCKYFTLNAASITMIAIAMKLPVDLSNLVAKSLDQGTKLGSMAFMCTMMANLIPSLASMDNHTLLANVIGLAILVITVIVNVCIQISTGAINNREILSVSVPVENGEMFSSDPTYIHVMIYMAHSYVAISVWLLIMLISSAITIPACKELLEIKYQATTKKTLNGQDSLASTVEKLNQYLRRYWVMAESGSPQFVMASNPLSITSGILCAFSLIWYVVLIRYTYVAILYNYSTGWESDYKWSMYYIAITQCIGVVVGSIAPILEIRL